jgi:hypothetical protein
MGITWDIVAKMGGTIRPAGDHQIPVEVWIGQR